MIPYHRYLYALFLVVYIRFPYAVLISVVVGITNDSILWTIYRRCCQFLFILIVKSVQSIAFALLILVIQQQFDGLYLGPKILGEKAAQAAMDLYFQLQLVAAFSVFLECSSGSLCCCTRIYTQSGCYTHFLGKRILQLPYDSHDRI